MVASADGVREFRVARALPPVLGFFAAGLALSVVYARTGVGVTCPFLSLTGWTCPLCGSTRMGSALLHGEWAQAFAMNPLVLLALTGLAVLATLWTVEALGGPAFRLCENVSTTLRKISVWGWLVAGLVVAISYTLVRNLG